MPQSIINTAENIWRVLLALYEPVLALSLLTGAIIMAALAEAGGGLAGLATGPQAPLFELVGFFSGFVADLYFRGRVYAAKPPDKRGSRLREWKSRLGLAFIGLAAAVLASIPVHVWLAMTWPLMGSTWFPVSNLFLVIIAVPVIDGVRGVARILSGQSGQEAFADAVISYIPRRGVRLGERRARGSGRGGEG